MRPLLLCCALLTALVAPAAAARGRGAIYISSLPTGADVWIDGTFVGESPILIAAVSLGHHVISVSKAGFAVRDVAVDLGDDTSPLLETISLKPVTTALRQSGVLAIRSDLAGGEVYLDGTLVGKLPLPSRRVSVGSHRVEVRLKGESVTREVQVYPDTESVVVMRAVNARGPVVIAPVESYLPAGVYTLVGGKLVIRYAGHTVVGHLDQRAYSIDGEPRRYDATPTLVAGRLYLPLALLRWLDAESKK